MPIRCLNCETGYLQTGQVQLPGTVRGEGYVVEMPGLTCPECGYATVEGPLMAEYGRLLSDKYREAHGLLTSEDIRSRRKELGMNQDDFARYLGVGVASVKRWEMGKIQDEHNNQRIIERTALPVHGTIMCSSVIVVSRGTSGLGFRQAVVRFGAAGRLLTRPEGKGGPPRDTSGNYYAWQIPQQTIPPHFAHILNHEEEIRRHGRNRR